MIPEIMPGSSPPRSGTGAGERPALTVGLLSPPNRDALSDRLFGTRLDLRLDQGAERMIHDHRGERDRIGKGMMKKLINQMICPIRTISVTVSCLEPPAI
jgi:hypothetical protein